VVDAAGAIYVIGGQDSGTWYHDVWVSTDGGARPDSDKGGGRRGTRGGTRGGTQGVLRTKGLYRGILRSTRGGYYRVLRGTTGVLEGYYKGSMSVLGGTTGVLRSTQELLQGY
jgi:hypothetical protein